MHDLKDPYWEHLDSLVSRSEIVINRPRGSTHPRFPDFVYPYDYGYLAETQGGDGDGIDVWFGSLPDRNLIGGILTVDLDKRDVEVKLLLGSTGAETEAILQAHNDGDQAATLVLRSAQT